MNNNELKHIAENLIPTADKAGKTSIDLYNKGIKITIKPDNSPVSNGDLEVNELLTNKVKELTPNIPIVSEETVDLKKKNDLKTFWLIDPIDGTKEYISGKDEYTINAALIENGKIIALNSPQKLISELISSGFKAQKKINEATLDDVFLNLTGKKLI